MKVKIEVKITITSEATPLEASADFIKDLASVLHGLPVDVEIEIKYRRG